MSAPENIGYPVEDFEVRVFDADGAVVATFPFSATGETAVVPREMKVLTPAGDVDGDGFDDFWLHDTYVNEDDGLRTTAN
jgi:hypothetical protein